MNTTEINYLHHLIEVNDQNSHLGRVYGVHVDRNKILGMEKFDVPLDLAFLTPPFVNGIEEKISDSESA